MNRNARGNERNPSPIVSFYNGDNAIGNARGSRADREGNNSGRNDNQGSAVSDRLTEVEVR